MKRFSYYLWAQLHSYEVSESRPQDKNPLPRQRVFIFHGGDEGGLVEMKSAPQASEIIGLKFKNGTDVAPNVVPKYSDQTLNVKVVWKSRPLAPAKLTPILVGFTFHPKK